MSVLIRGSRRQVTYCRETNPGETPINPAMKHFRGLPGVSLNREVNKLESNEITSDRQKRLPRLGKFSTKGELPVEYAFGAFDDFIEAALGSDAGWSTGLTLTASTITASAGGNTFTDSGGGFAFSSGDLVEVSGFENPANNGLFRVTQAAAGVLTVAGRSSLADEAAGADITIVRPEYVVVGSTRRSFTFEEKLRDIITGANGQRYLGQVVDGWSLTIGVDSLVTGSFSLLGRDGLVSETVKAATLSAQSSDNSFNDSAGGLGAFAAGDALYASGFGETGNNGVFTVMTASSGKVTVDGSLTDEAAGVSATLTTALPQPLEAMNGNEAFAGIDKGHLFFENGKPFSLVTDLSFNLANNNAAYWQLGGRGAIDVLDGSFTASGTMTVYVKDLELTKRFLNEEESSLEFTLIDPDGNAYTHILPAIRYTGAPLAFNGDGAITSAMPWDAGRSDIYQTTMIVIRRPA